MTDRPIFSRRVILAAREVSATIHIDESGHIAAIEEDRHHPGAFDFGDDLVIPGLVELHTDHLELHYSPRPHVYWNPLSAVFAYDAQVAAAGMTTVLDSLRAGSDADRKATDGSLLALGEAVAVAREAGRLRVDHHTHLRCEICSEDVIEETEGYLGRFDVRLISLMDHTPGQRQFRDEEKLKIYYRGKGGLGEDQLQRFIEERKALHHSNAETNRRRLVDLARAGHVALASHDDTTVDHVAESVRDGIVVAEFPTTVEAARASHEAGLAVLMGAPNVVRGGSHSGNVSARSLAEAGILDILSSDYVPISLIEGAFALAGAGMDLPSAIRTVSLNPARSVGFDDRGEIAVGKRADLVRVSMVRGHPVVRETYVEGRRVI